MCPTKIITFSERAKDFHKLGGEVLGVSVDSQFPDLACINITSPGRRDVWAL